MSEAALSITTGSCDTAGSIKRRYYLLMLSVFLVDMVVSGIFMTLTGSWHLASRIIVSSALVLLVVNFLLAQWQFAPIARFLDGKIEFAAIERRMTQLQIQSARNVGILTFILLTFRMGLPFFVADGYR